MRLNLRAELLDPGNASRKVSPPAVPSWFQRKRAYASRHTARAAYLGWLGYRNLGDEVLYQAFRSAFGPLEVLPAAMGALPRLVERFQGQPLYRCCFLGGGTLINTTYNLCFRDLLARYKPGFVFGSGVCDPEENARWGKPNRLKEWVAVLSECAQVGVRGPVSAAILKAHSFKAARVIGDPMLWFANPTPAVKLGNRVLGLNLGIANGCVLGGEDQVLNHITLFGRKLIAEGWRIRLLPVWPPDVPYLQELARRLGLPSDALLVDFLNYDRVQEFLKQVDVFVGEKLHASIAAICSGTPTIMLEYQTKCRDFMTSLGLEHYSLPTDRLRADVLLDMVTAVHADLERIQREVVSATQSLRRELVAAADKIKHMMAHRGE